MEAHKKRRHVIPVDSSIAKLDVAKQEWKSTFYRMRARDRSAGFAGWKMIRSCCVGLTYNRSSARYTVFFYK